MAQQTAMPGVGEDVTALMGVAPAAPSPAPTRRSETLTPSVPGTLSLYGRSRVTDRDGRASSVRARTIRDERRGSPTFGKQVLIPTVLPDPRIKGRSYVASDERAQARFEQTGEHLGAFDTQEAADLFAEQLERDIAAGTYDREPPNIGADVTDLFATPSPPDVTPEAVAAAQPDFRTTNARDPEGRPIVADEAEGGVFEAAGDFLGEATKGLNPVTIAQSVSQAFFHPVETAKGVLSAQDQVRQDALAAFQAGDYVTGAAKMLYWAIPLLGPRLAEAGDLLAEGETAKGLGAATDVGLQIAAPAALSRLREIRLTRGMRPKNPVEAAAVAEAERAGVPMDAGTATGNRFVKGVQKLADESLLGSRTAEAAREAQAAGLVKMGEALADRTTKVPATLEQAGAFVQQSLETRITNLHQAANTAYDTLRQIEASVRPQTRAPHPGAPLQSMRMAVDVRPTKAALQPIYARLKREAELVPLQGSKAKALTTLDRLMEGPDFAPLSAADGVLSELKAAARGADLPELRTQGQGIAAKAVQSLDQQVRATAAREGGRRAVSALNAGRAATKQKYAVAEILDGLRTEPVKTLRDLVARQDTAIEQLRAVVQEAPGTAPVLGRAVLDDMLHTATAEGGFQHAAKLASDWQKIGDATKRVLFKDPDYIQSLDRFFLAAKKAAESPNPSGTALTLWKGGEMGMLFTNPAQGVPYSLTMGAVSKLLHSPAGVRLLTRGLAVPVGNRAAMATYGAELLSALDRVQAPRPVPIPAGEAPPAAGDRRGDRR